MLPSDGPPPPRFWGQTTEGTFVGYLSARMTGFPCRQPTLCLHWLKDPSDADQDWLKKKPSRIGEGDATWGGSAYGRALCLPASSGLTSEKPRKPLNPGAVRGLSRASYQNRTDDLFITSEGFPEPPTSSRSWPRPRNLMVFPRANIPGRPLPSLLKMCPKLCPKVCRRGAAPKATPVAAVPA